LNVALGVSTFLLSKVWNNHFKQVNLPFFIQEWWLAKAEIKATKLPLPFSPLHFRSKEGFCIHSAEFNFDHGVGAEMLPNLMEWVMPDSRPQIFCWLQDHVNAFISGQTCTLAIFCEVFFFGLKKNLDLNCLFTGGG